ncbi:MAG: hypothetical protein ACREBR_04115, partial [bacterium]
MSAELRVIEANQWVERRADDARPQNTKSAYSPKQKEFSNWCDENGFADGCTVNQEKLLCFLKERVVDRHCRVGINKGDPLSARS